MPRPFVIYPTISSPGTGLQQRLKRINKLIKDIQRDPFSGIGKPEPLKYDFQGAWSRRIDAENRLIYMIDGKSVAFLSFKDHY